MTCRDSVEGEIQEQNIHAGLAKYSRRARPRIFGNQPSDLIFAQSTNSGNPGHLLLRSGGTNLRIQTAGRGRHNVDWSLLRGSSGIAFHEVLEPQVDRVEQRFVGGSQVRAAR